MRGSAPSARTGISLLRPTGLRRALFPLDAEPMPPVLQSGLPSGVTACDRTRTALAAARAPGTAATCGTPGSRALSLVVRYRPGCHDCVRMESPPKEEGAAGVGTASAPR